MKYSLDKAISMYYNKNTALNVVLYLSHRELILDAVYLKSLCVMLLYLSHRELIPDCTTTNVVCEHSFTFPIGN